MIVRLFIFVACLSTVSQARVFPQHSRNPARFLKAFADGLVYQSYQNQSILESFGDKKDLGALFQDHALNNPLIGNISKCAVSYTTFWKDVVMTKNYAIRMLDSWGKLPSGLALGNLQWMGRYHECLNAHTDKFSGKYFYLLYGKSTAQPTGLGATSAAVGVCLPSSCSSQQAQQLVQPIFNLMKTTVHVYYPVQPTEYTATDVLALVITSLLGCLVIAGTIYEHCIINKTPSDAEYHRLEPHPEIPTQQKMSVFSNLALSFSFIKNTKAVFDTTQKEGNINVLHGLRFFSMTWVILGHSFIFGSNYIDNGLDAASVFISDWKFQAVGNATFSVDSFFFFSGLLAAYLGLKELKKRAGKINVPLMFAYRYLRLTPAYAFCILISASLYSKFGDGPYWPQTAESFRKPCQDYWWTNLLYINNMYPISLGQECFAWGWYLANDMQFFLLLPLLLLIMHRRPLIGALVLNIGVIFSMIATGVISAHYKEQPMALQIGLGFHSAVQNTLPNTQQLSVSGFSTSETTNVYPTNVTTPHPSPSPPQLSKFDTFWSDTYSKPWCRFGAYFVGVMTGLIMYKSNTRVRMNKVLAVVGWLIASATGMALVYGLFGDISNGEYISVHLAAFYNAVCRPLWTFCLMWVVVACAGGYGGPINTFLSWKAFIPLSRLTYCAYLVHPLVIYWVYGIFETKLHFSLGIIAVLYAGIVPISYGIAFVISILIEMPMLGITKAIFGKAAEVKKIPVDVPEVINVYKKPPENTDSS